MKQCIRCSQLIDDDSSFCPYCGTPQGEPAVQPGYKEEPKKIPGEGYSSPFQQNAEYGQQPQPSYSQPGQLTYDQGAQPANGQVPQPNAGYGQQPQPSYEQQGLSSYGQGVQPAYSQQPQPNAGYGQTPSPYGQGMQPAYGQQPQPNAGYSQSPSPYGQGTQPNYGQPPQPSLGYGQQPQPSYGQPSQSPYGQGTQPAYSQMPQPNGMYGQQPQPSYSQPGQPGASGQGGTGFFAKIPKPLLIIVPAVLILLIVGVAVFSSIRGAGSSEKAIQNFYNTLATGNSKKLVSSMMPKEMEKAIDKAAKNGEFGQTYDSFAKVMDDIFDNYKQDGFKIDQVKITKREKLDKQDVENFEKNLVNELNAKVKITEAYKVKTTFRYRKNKDAEWEEDDMKLTIYKSGNRWYAIPSSLF